MSFGGVYERRPFLPNRSSFCCARKLSRNLAACLTDVLALPLSPCTALVATSRLNGNERPAGIQISDGQFGAVNTTPNEHVPKWNYTIRPCPSR